MFSRKSIGIEITQDRIRVALVSGSHSKPFIESLQEAVFAPDTLRVSIKEPNILQQSAFVSTVRETSFKLNAKTSRTGVALPDASGRVMLLDLDTRFKSREEGADIIKWKLKKNFPYDINDAHLDFQVLQERDSGEVSVLVSVICKQVLQQYEELLVEAGLEPNQIDFTAFRIFELFSSKLNVNDDYIFVCHMEGLLSIMIFNQGILTFYRTKELGTTSFSINRAYREISSSLLVYQDRHPGFSSGKVYCFVADNYVEDFRTLLSDATGQEPVILEAGRVITKPASTFSTPHDLFIMSAAIGSGLRNL